MRRRKPAASTLAAAPQPARRHGPPPRPCSHDPRSPPGSVVEPVAGRTPSPSRPPPNPVVSASARGPEMGDPEMEETAHREMVTAPLPPPEEGQVENLLFHFVFVLLLAQKQVAPTTSIKEWFSQSLGLKRRRVVSCSGVSGSLQSRLSMPILHAEITVLLAKDAIELVPPADMRSGFYSPCFIVPKKSSRLRPIMDLRVLNHALHKLPFKMLNE